MTSFKCDYCTRVFDDSKKLNVHTPDCKRKHIDNPSPRHCPNCKADYTRKSGSAYRTHLKKCSTNNVDDVKSDSAIKQSERRKQVLVFASCKYCSEEFRNITVGKLGDHQYKCKKNKPNYDKEYQAKYRNETKILCLAIKDQYPEIEQDIMKKMCKKLRSLKKDHTETNPKTNPKITKTEIQNVHKECMV